MTTTQNTWSEHEIGGISCHVLSPPTPHDHEYTILYLPDDSGGNKIEALPEACADLQQRQLRVVLPQLASTWAIDQPVAGQDEDATLRELVMDRLIPGITDKLNAAPPRIALLGDGMGGQAALRIGFEDPRTFPIVYAARPKVDFHLLVRQGHEELTERYGDEEAARQDTAILHVHPLHYPRFMFYCCDPTEYPWFDGADRLRMKMAASGIMHESDLETSVEESEEDSNEDYFQKMLPSAIHFLDRHLDRERLRLV